MKHKNLNHKQVKMLRSTKLCQLGLLLLMLAAMNANGSWFDWCSCCKKKDTVLKIHVVDEAAVKNLQLEADELWGKSWEQAPKCKRCSQSFPVTYHKSCGHYFCFDCEDNTDVEGCIECGHQSEDEKMIPKIMLYRPCDSDVSQLQEKLQNVLPMMCASTNARLVIWYIEKYNLDVNKEGLHGYYPIHFCQTKEVLQYLLKRGADENQKHKERGMTPFLYAVFGGNFEMTKFFVEVLNIPIDQKLIDGCNAMFFAAWQDSPEIMKYLEDKGLSLWDENTDFEQFFIQGCDRGGMQALEYSVKRWKEDFTKDTAKEKFLKRENEKKYPPLILAAAAGYFEAVRFLLEQENEGWYFGDITIAWCQATDRAQYDVVKFLTTKREINFHKVVGGFTPLMYLVISEFTSEEKATVASLILDTIEDKSFLDQSDQYHDYTALGYACINGHKKLVEIFIKAGANVNIISSKKGGTPLFLAFLTGQSKIFELLVTKYGASVLDARKVIKTRFKERLEAFDELCVVIAAESARYDIVEAKRILRGFYPFTRLVAPRNPDHIFARLFQRLWLPQNENALEQRFEKYKHAKEMPQEIFKEAIQDDRRGTKTKQLFQELEIDITKAKEDGILRIYEVMYNGQKRFEIVTKNWIIIVPKKKKETF